MNNEYLDAKLASREMVWCLIVHNYHCHSYHYGIVVITVVIITEQLPSYRRG